MIRTYFSQLRICLRSSREVEERNKRFIRNCFVNKFDRIGAVYNRLKTRKDRRKDGLSGN
jgi:hypothetical protein